MTRNEALKVLTAAGQPYELETVVALGREIRAFKNAPVSLRAVIEAARSDATFIVFEDERLTFNEVWERASRLATTLSQTYGVRKADRVAISMRNYPEWIVAFNAIVSIGAVAVAMNALWQSPDLEFALHDSGAKVLLADPERLERLAACKHLPPDLAVIAVRTSGALPRGVAAYDEVIAAAAGAAMPDAAIAPDDDAIMLYTSGSTGNPKGAVSTHRNVISALLSWELDAAAVPLIDPSIVPPDPAAAPQPVSLLAIPLFHVSGLHVSLLQSYRAQRRLVTMYKWDPDLAAELIERERVTGFNGPPAVTHDLVEVARRTKRDLSSLVAVGGGGAPRAPEQVRDIDGAFPNAAPNTGWGMTETNAIGVSISGADYLTHPASSGRVSAVLDIRIVDAAGDEVASPGRGELQIRGASIMRGYWNRPDADAAAFDGEWFRTGDVAYLDADGFLYIVDRIKDLVIRGGENIGCGAVEAALLEHPDVVEASVYGVPEPRLGEEVAASVYARQPLGADTLKAFLRGRLAQFEIPSVLEIVYEPLPRIASGKIFKRELRERAILRRSEGVVHAR
ncbi:MAG: fatty acid--CoA ligase [Phenylobacterium zucineum]|jgi:long-chain acyl-CoA synthetase|nr:MAG: fatty acid--CoA ligase [Phenylobacterium zucineum]